MASRRTIIDQAARHYGISPSILYGVWGAESHFGKNKGPSTAGAEGDFQFMPATARSLGVRIGNFRSEAFGAAKYLSQYRSRGRAGMLAAYNAGPAGNPHNPETQAYIPKVLSYARTYKGGGGGGGGAVRSPRGWTEGQTLLQMAGGGAGNVPQGSEGILPLLQALSSQKPQVPSSGSLPAPAHSAAPVMPQGAQTPLSGGGPAPKPDVNALLDLVRTVGGNVAHSNVPGVSALIGGGGSGGGGGGGASVGGRGGRVVLAPGADRAGVRTRPEVLAFARRISSIAGGTVKIGTGSAHSRLTVNGTVSDHWRGEAADVPATGARLVKLGQAALIAAGMSPAKARRIRGGGFNVGGWQVIFNTNARGWGNHTTHLHVGRRR